MKKTFRRVLASMLAVLMVLCAMPFTAFAAQANRQWWTAEELPLTEEPTYWGYNSPEDETHQPAGPWELSFGDTVELEIDGDYEDHRDDYKPIIAVTVSSQGQNGLDYSELKSKYYNKYYGQSSARTYDQVKNDGLLLDPATLKAGQRIAVALEFGGFDIISNGQFKGKFDTSYLKPAYYKSAIRNKDTWTEIPGADSAGFISDGSEYYAKALSFAGANIDVDHGSFYLGVTSKNFVNGQLTKSNFIGTGLADETGARSFGKYGIYSGTMSFEVLKDCNLSEVLTFDTGYGGTAFQPIHEDNPVVKADGLKYVTIDDTDRSFAKFAPVIWSESSASQDPEPLKHVHHYTEVKTPATCTEDGKITYTCSNEDHLCDKPQYTVDDPEAKALGHDYTSPLCEITSKNDGANHIVKCLRYNECESTQEVACSWQQTDDGYEATYGAPGKAPTFTCEKCSQTKGGEEIPALKGYEVTVAHKDLGTSEINETPVTDADVKLNVAPNSEITLVAKPNEGVTFVGWMVNSTIVSTEKTFKPQVIANTTYEPVFQEDEGAKFTVVFTDMYGNIFNTQTVNSGSEIEVPEGPVIAGYTFTGWSMSKEEITALSSAATIQAKYDRIVEKTYTVTAKGATISTPYSSTSDENTGIGYNTQVTVHAEGAKVWKIDNAIVGYGDTYIFYVGANVELTFEKDVVTETPVVAAISTDKIGSDGKYKASFLASRKLVDGYTYVNAGFIYGANLEKAANELTLDDVDQKTVRAYYCATDSEQFALNVGRVEQSGKISARAFLAYTKDDGEDGTQIVYATFDDFSYNS